MKKPGKKRQNKKMYLGTFEDEETKGTCGFHLFMAASLTEAKKLAAQKGLADFAALGKMYLKGYDF